MTVFRNVDVIVGEVGNASSLEFLTHPTVRVERRGSDPIPAFGDGARRSDEVFEPGLVVLDAEALATSCSAWTPTGNTNAS